MAEKVIRKVSIYVDGERVIDNIKGIKAELKKLQNEQNKTTLNSEEYVEKSQRIAELNSILDEHRQNLRDSGSSWDKLKQKVEDFTGFGIGKLALFGGVLAGVFGAFKQGFSGAVALEKSLSQLSSLTGASANDLIFYRDEAIKMGKDMGMSAEDIVKSFQLIGSAKPDLLKSKDSLASVTKEALILAKAAGMEVPDSAKRLTDAMNQYSIAGKDASRVSNALAAGAKEGAVEIPEQTDAMLKFGAVASGANVTIEESIGLIQTLGDKGIKGAEAGTQIRNILLKLEAGAKDTRPSIVGLETAFENLAKKQLSTTELTKMFGMESVVAAQNLIKSSDKIKYYTDAVTGTNEATKQATINQDNLATTWDKTINKIKLSITSFVAKSGLVGLLNTGLKEVNKAMDSVGDSSKSATEKFNNQVSSVVSLKMNIEPLADRYDYLQGKTNKSVAEQAEMKRIIGQVASEIPSAITQFDKYGNAIEISTNRVRGFINAEVDRMKVMNKQAIKEVESNLNELNDKLRTSKAQVDDIAKNGYVTKTTFNVSTNTPHTEFIRDKKVIDEVIGNYQQLLEEKRGYEAELKRLNGTNLKNEVDAAEKAAKAEADARKKAAKDEEDARRAAAAKAAKDEADAKAKAKREKILADQKSLNEQLSELADAIAAKQRTAEQNEIKEVEKKYEKLKKLAHGNKEMLAELEDLKGREITSIQVKYNNMEIDKFMENAQKEADIEGEKIIKETEAKKNAKQQITEALQTAEEKERDRIKKHYDELIALAKKYGFDTAELMAKMKQELDAIQNGGNRDIFGMNEKDWNNFNKKFTTAMSLANELYGMWSAYGELQTNKENTELNQKEKRAEKEKKSLKKKLDSGIISQKTYEAKVEAIDEKLDANKKVIAQRQFKRQQTLNSVMTVMNTASAIVGFLKDPGGYPGIALSVMAGITGALQLAAINSASLPGYIDGGRVEGKQLAWLSEDGKEEGVLNNRTMTSSETAPIANWLLDRQEGKSTAFPTRKLPTPASSSAVNALRSSRSSTSVIQRDSAVNGQNSSNSSIISDEMLSEIKRLNGYLSDPENRRAFITNETLDQREKENEIQKKMSTLKK